MLVTFSLTQCRYYFTSAAQKRHIFDQYGEEGLKSMGGPSVVVAATPSRETRTRYSNNSLVGDPFSAFGNEFSSCAFQFGGPSMSQAFQFGGEEEMNFAPSGSNPFMGGFGGPKRPRAPR